MDELERTEETERVEQPEAAEQPRASSDPDPAALPQPCADRAPAAAHRQVAEPDPAAAPDPARVPDSIVDGEEHAVDPRSVMVDRIATIPLVLGVAVVPFVALTATWGLDGIPTRVYLPLLAGVLVLFAMAAAVGYKWPELHHRHLRYRVDETGVRIRRGVLWRKVISIPTSRVQHTDVSQGPLQRNFGLATLTVYTAGTEGASISLEGLEHGVAKRLRDHLLPDHQADAL